MVGQSPVISRGLGFAAFVADGAHGPDEKGGPSPDR